MDDIQNSWSNYPSIFNLGHKAIEELFNESVLIEEKIDGSQFSFGVIDGVLRCKSKGKELIVDEPEKMFQLAVNTVKRLHTVEMLKEGWTYRGEYLQKPKHNTLCYDRVPKLNIILFDVNTGHESYLSYEEKAAEAFRLGLEVVPMLYEGMVTSIDQLKEFLERQSILGATTIEGMVIKNYARFGEDKKALMGKWVRDEFKELHKINWKTDNPGMGDVVQNLVKELRSDARWQKAIQHMQESGELTNTPKDIGGLMREVKADVKKECTQHIKDAMFKWAWPQIERGIVGGFPDWYKTKLAESQFKADPDQACKKDDSEA